MSSLVNATRQYDSQTDKGATTHSTSLSYLVDMFFLAGASKEMSAKDIITVFERAFAQDKNIAVKILFWSRDVRGGAGERRFFQIIMKHLLENRTELFESLIVHAPQFGSWKDVLRIEDPSNQDVLNWLSIQLREADESPGHSLLAKWFPRKGPWFTHMHKYMGITPKELRQLLVRNTNVVESKVCTKDWSSINFSKVPSLAMNRHRKTFMKHAEFLFLDYISDVQQGKQKINASAIYPYQLYQAMNRGDNPEAVTAQWNALPDYMADTTERIFPVCDVSASMEGLPMDVSISLGIYISERNRGIFKDCFITFSHSPEMLHLQGELQERMWQMKRSRWSENTDLQKTFQLILDSVVREGIKEEEMPTKMLIISDMEFDEACPGMTNLESIRKKYQRAGYTMPELVFWNVNGRLDNSPASILDPGVGLVSGFSPSILKSILKGKIYGPEQLMLDTVMTDRYKAIRAD